MRLYHERPKNPVARKAWDHFSRFRVRTANPVEMRLAFLSYWVWVMEYSDGWYEEFERCEIWR